MKRHLLVSVSVCLAALAGTALAQDRPAANLVISNARILDGRGGEIKSGSVVVRDGKIVSVAPGNASAPGARMIDAKGMTVMPGFIEAHRHLIQGDGAQWMKE
jgi:imidazolonepropionase-like amidohydrolase